MANDVYSYVNFKRISEEGIKRCEEVFSRLTGWDDEDTYEYALHEVFGLPEELDEEGYNKGPGSYGWNIDNVGAKWAYIEDPSPDFGFTVHSAWSVPFDGIEYILNEIHKVDPNFIASVSYEDEMPNFVGWVTYHTGSFDEGREWEWDEIEDWIMDNHEDIAACYDREEKEWIEGKEDEGQSLVWDYVREFIDDVSWITLDEELTWYLEHEEEIKAELAESE